MATPVVLTTNARPITPVESGGVPMTPVDTLGEPVTVVDALGEPVVLINNDGTPAYLAYSAKTYLGGVAPYHWLDFVNNRALYAGADVGNVTGATGYSFSRASQGYYTDSAGVLTLFGYNLLLQSQTFDDAYWTKSDTTVTANAATAPDGTLTADKIVASATTAVHKIQRDVSVSSPNAYTFSVFAKAAEYGFCSVNTGGSGGAGLSARTAVVNLTTGALVSETVTGMTTITALASGWYRISVTTAAATGSGSPGFFVEPLSTSTAGSYTGDGTSGIFIWGAQLEPSASLGSYVPTTTSAAGALRRGDRGVLIEGSRTNLCLQSQTFDNAGWTKGGATVSANSVTAPDGMLTADTLTEDTSTGDHRTFQLITLTAAAHTFTVYLKPNGRSLVTLTFAGIADVTFDISAGTVTSTVLGTGEIAAATNGWYRCVLKFTGTATSYNAQIRLVSTGTTTSYTGNGTSGVYVWGAQLEAASFPSSYIPTTTASVTRASDVLTYTAGVSYGLSLWTEFERAVDTGGDEELLRCAFDGNERSTLSVRSSGDLARAIQRAGASDVADLTVGGALALNVVHKMAARFALNSVRLACAGTLSTEDTVAAAPTNPVLLTIATAGSTFGYTRRIAVFNSALTDAQLTASTT